ncbi:MAG: hypothetical protein KDD51_03915 [Bdellovibrionales bacterium]|nr:hypothetical protein [Bdellovibrionales bacterium]
MFEILEKIDKAIESKSRVRLINKMGKYFRGAIVDSWARASSGRMRGKIQFQTDEKVLDIDVNDIMDILPEPEK